MAAGSHGKFAMPQNTSDSNNTTDDEHIRIRNRPDGVDSTLPCPFCGSTNLDGDSDGYATEWVVCGGCGAQGPKAPYSNQPPTPWDTWAVRCGQPASEDTRS